MKKEYEIPEIDVIRIDLDKSILEGSTTGQDDPIICNED